MTRRGHLAYFKSLGQMDRERGKPTAEQERVFVFCHNPVKQDADAAGAAGAGSMGS